MNAMTRDLSEERLDELASHYANLAAGGTSGAPAP
jgi:cytochrome c553